MGADVIYALKVIIPIAKNGGGNITSNLPQGRAGGREIIKIRYVNMSGHGKKNISRKMKTKYSECI